MTKKYKSEPMAAIHETIEALHDAGLINKKTMRQFGQTCLTPIHFLTPTEIRAIREKEHVSQKGRKNPIETSLIIAYRCK